VRRIESSWHKPGSRRRLHFRRRFAAVFCVATYPGAEATRLYSYAAPRLEFVLVLNRGSLPEKPTVGGAFRGVETRVVPTTGSCATPLGLM
jgi:hypothetical protein